MSSNQNRNNAFQGLRAIAFLGIFISHAEIGNFGYLGAWGVSVFLVLSGFLMMYNYFPKDIKLKSGFCFAIDKISKLYILHIISTLLYAAYIIYTGGSLKRTIINIILHSLLIQAWIPNIKYSSTLNVPAWYLCVSFFTYMIFPYILIMFKQNFSKKKAISFISIIFIFEILLSILSFLLNNHDNSVWFSTQWLTYYFPIVRAFDFLAGCCLGYLFLLKKEHNKNHLYEIFIFILIALSMVIYAHATLEMRAFKFTLLFLPSSLCLIWLIAADNGILSKLLSQKPLVWLGNISTYTFLIHGVVIRYGNAIFKNKLLIDNKSFIFIVNLVLTIISAFFWNKLIKFLKRNNKQNKFPS